MASFRTATGNGGPTDNVAPLKPPGVAPNDAQSAVAAARWAWILEPQHPSGARVWGLTASERLRRSLARAGVPQVRSLPAEAPPPPAVEGPCVVLRGDLFYDDRLVRALLDSGPEALLCGGESCGATTGELPDWVAARVGGARLGEVVEVLRRSETEGTAEAPAGIETTDLSELVPAYNPALRKRDVPFVFPARADRVREIENRIFAASYKGLTDLVTKWVWPLPAREATRWLARHRVPANTVTALSWLLAILTVVAFATGWFATGLALGWAMTFLDTVDGKLARCTLTTSRLGHVMDHGLDLVHPPIWWIAFGVGLLPTMPGVEWPTVVIVGGYLLGRLLEGVFMLAFRMEIFLWQPFDGFFRTIIARRNPNLLLLTAGVAFGRPDLGFLAVAFWAVSCNVVHAVRLVQAFAQRRRGIPIRAWYEVQEAA